MLRTPRLRGANRFDLDEPTLDPVELERQRIAEAKAEAEAFRRTRVWSIPAILAIAVAVFSVVAYVAVWAANVGGAGGPEGYVLSTDFVATLTGAEIVHSQKATLLYDPDIQRATQAQLRASAKSASTNFVPYDRPPYGALLVAPLLALPSWLAFAFWTLGAGGFAIGLAVGLMDSALPVSRQVGWVLSLVGCSYFPVIRTLMSGGDSTLVLMGICGTYLALKTGSQPLAAGALLLVASRPQMLPVFLLVLLLQRRFATVGLFLIFLGTLSVVIMPVFGVGWPVTYLRFLAGPHGWGAPNLPVMQNWRGLAHLLLGDAAPQLVVPLFLLLVSGTFTLLVWAWERARTWVWVRTSWEVDEPEDYEPRTDLLWALAAISAVLTAVYLTPHDLAILIFPAWIIGAYIANSAWARDLSTFWTVVLWVGYALAPLTLYSANAALAVVPTVLLLATAAILLARTLASGPHRADGYQPVL
jgi:hypothetical protein